MPSAQRSMLIVIPLTLLLLITPSVKGERVWFGDSKNFHVIEGKDYNAHNIFVANGTTLTLESGTIVAPESGDDGESAIRVDDATFIAKKGKISGGLGVGGTGVTISTTRDSEYPPGSATFEAGVEVYGGDATRERTTKGGDAVQVLQAGSRAVINGGKFVPGTGCTVKACGTATGDGNALQVVQGEAIIKGGTFEGVLYNVGGDIALYGCVKFDKETAKISGVLRDGSPIDIVYKGQKTLPSITYESKVCPPVAHSPSLESGGGKAAGRVALIIIGLYLLGTKSMLK
mmetsp:Transcript_31327/g.66673  ORF Transcript_31327/g.66673 Transcript_31327/m.66673 type:complete len:288 (+) Transcript_31327:68-931(+)